MGSSKHFTDDDFLRLVGRERRWDDLVVFNNMFPYKEGGTAEEFVPKLVSIHSI